MTGRRPRETPGRRLADALWLAGPLILLASFVATSFGAPAWVLLVTVVGTAIWLTVDVAVPAWRGRVPRKRRGESYVDYRNRLIAHERAAEVKGRGASGG